MPACIASASDADEVPRRAVDLADHEGGVRVAVDPFDEGGDIDVHDIALEELAAVGDAVADDLVDRGAERLGEPPVVERTRVGATGDAGVVADPVEFVGRDAGSDRRADLDEATGGDATGDPHVLDLVGRAHGAAGARRRLAGERVLGTGDPGGDGAPRSPCPA